MSPAGLSWLLHFYQQWIPLETAAPVFTTLLSIRVGSRTSSRAIPPHWLSFDFCLSQECRPSKSHASARQNRARTHPWSILKKRGGVRADAPENNGDDTALTGTHLQSEFSFTTHSPTIKQQRDIQHQNAQPTITAKQGSQRNQAKHTCRSKTTGQKRPEYFSVKALTSTQNFSTCPPLPSTTTNHPTLSYFIDGPDCRDQGSSSFTYHLFATHCLLRRESSVPEFA